MKKVLLILMLAVLFCSAKAQTWSALGSGTDQQVSALYADNSMLYVGGNFTTAGGVSNTNVAAWDGASWVSLGTGLDSYVNCIVKFNGEIYAGGGSFFAGTSTVSKWDGVSWTPVGSMNGADTYTLCEFQGELYAGGPDGLFKLVSGAWVNLQASGISALCVFNNELIVSGFFSVFGGTPANDIARFDGAVWNGMGNGLTGGGPASALYVFNNVLYAGGTFANAGVVSAPFIASWDGATWSSVGSSVNTAVRTIGEYNGELYIGGDFTNAAYPYLAKLSAGSWVSPGMPDASVWALALFNNSLYTGGTFLNIDITPAKQIANFSDPKALGVFAYGTDPKCFGNADGTAGVNAFGGTSPYTYLWNTAPSQTSATATGLTPGVYNVTVTDAAAGVATAAVTLNASTPLSPSTVLIQHATTNFSCDGAASVNATGGTTPYSYLWDDAGSTTTQTGTSFCTGTFHVTVTDAHSCFATASIVIATQSVELSLKKDTLKVIRFHAGVGIYPGDSVVYSVKVYNNGGVDAQNVVVQDQIKTTNQTYASNKPSQGTYSFTYSKWGVGKIVAGDSAELQIRCAVKGPAPATISNTARIIRNSGNGSGTQPFGVDTIPSNELDPGAGGSGDVGTTTLSLKLQPAFTAMCPPSCDNSCAVASASGIGGATPYTYAWELGPPAGPANSFPYCTPTGFAVRNVTVTDNDGYVQILSFNVSIAPPMVLNAIATPSYGTCQNKIAVSPSNYAYQIPFTKSSVPSIANYNQVCTGSYSISLTDGNGCTGETTVSVASSPDLKVVKTQSFQRTHAGTNIYPLDTVTYSIQVINLSSTIDLASPVNVYDTLSTNLTYESSTASTGIYNLGSHIWGISTLLKGDTAELFIRCTIGTVPYQTIINTAYLEDNVGPVLNSSVQFDVESDLNVTLTAHNVSCNGAGDGTVTATPSGGIGAYTYQWSPAIAAVNSPTESSGSAAPATYCITVTDGIGGTVAKCITVSEPQVLTIASAYSKDVQCFGSNNGSLDSMLVTGGNPSALTPFYTIISDAGSLPATNLAPGNYGVTVTDMNSCTASATVAIITPGPFLLQDQNIINPTCASKNDGSFELEVQSDPAYPSLTTGVAPYQYAMENAVNGTIVAPDVFNAINNIYQNTYHVTVTDANGCSLTHIVTLAAPASSIFTVSITKDNIAPACANQISASVSGGVGPFGYAWNNSVTSNINSGICPGPYSVTVSNPQSCTQTSAVIVQATHGDLTLNKQHTIHRIHPGTMIVRNDTVVYEVIVGNPMLAANLLVVVEDTIPVGLKHLSNKVSHGVYDLNTHLWSLDSVKISSTDTLTITCLVDTSDLTITNRAFTQDPSPIQKSASTSFQVVPALSVVAQTPSTTVCANSAVVITAIASDGAAGYLYKWDDGSSASAATFNDVNNITHTVTVTDAAGATATSSVSLTVLPVPVIATAITTHGQNCKNNIKSSATGALSPYTFKWNTSQTIDSINNACPGLYSLTVTDANQCYASTQINIAPISNDVSVNKTQNIIRLHSGTAILPGDTVVYDVTVTNNGGYTVTNALVNDTLPAGVSLVQASVSNGVFSSSKHTWMLPSFVPGGSETFSCKAIVQPYYPHTPIINTAWFKDSTFGAQKSSVNFEVNTQPGVYIDSMHAICRGQCITIRAHAYNGEAPYTFSWDGQAFGTIDTLNVCDTITAMHNLTVSDAGNNTFSVSVNVKVIANPHLQALVDTLAPNCMTALKASAYGSSSLSYTWGDGSHNSTLKNVCEGVYYVTATDLQGCYAKDSVVVDIANTLIIKLKGKDPLCFGSTDGNIDVFLNGGIAPFRYTWNPAVTSLTALSAGTYSVTVSDAVDNINTATIILNNPSPLQVTDSIHNLICANGKSGYAEVRVKGGFAPYKYRWSNGFGDSYNLFNADSGRYTCSVTDAHACLTTISLTLTQPSMVDIQATVTPVNCYGDSTASITLAVSGGSSPYMYKWSNEATSPGLTLLKAGDYSVKVIDDNGCAVYKTLTVTEPEKLDYKLTFKNASCVGCTNGNIRIGGIGGSPNYTYFWNPTTLPSSGSLDNLGAGDYSVTITDTHLCTVEALITIEEEKSTLKNPTGIGSLVDGGEIRIYPNPATDAIVIENTASNPLIQKISIWGTEGRTVYSGEVKATQKIDMSKWPAGVYLLKVGERSYRVIKQ